MGQVGTEVTSDPLDPRSVKELPTHAHAVDYVSLAEAFTLSQEVQIIAQETQQEVATLTKGKPLVIRTNILEVEANRLVIILKQQLANAEAERTGAKVKILEAGRIIDGKAKVFSATLIAGKELLEAALKEWDDYQTEQARIAQDKINEDNRKKQEKENEKAVKKGVEPKQVAPPAQVQTPPKSTTVEVGGRTVTRVWVDNWKAKITGVSDTAPVNAESMQGLGIPARFFVLDRGMLNAEAKRMKCEDPIPGSKVVGWNDRYQR